MPVFLIGTQRSGSNLLRLMLDQSQELVAPHPPHILERLGPHEGRYGDLSDPGNFGRMIDDVCRVVETNPVEWGLPTFDRADIRRRCRETSLMAVYGAVHDVLAEATGAADWFCKSLANVHFLDGVDAYFGDRARYIHLHRDPRDVAMSFRKAIVGEKTWYHIAEQWQDEQAKALTFARGPAASRCFQLAYGDLVADPRGRLEELCAFLGIAFRPDMLDFHRSQQAQSTAKAGAMWNNVARPVMSQNTNKFFREAPLDAINSIERVAGEAMAVLGYQQFKLPGSDAPFSAEEVESLAAENRKLKVAALDRADLSDLERKRAQTEVLEEIFTRLGVKVSKNLLADKLARLTRQREMLRRSWDTRRNIDLLELLETTLVRALNCERYGLFVAEKDGDRLWLERGTGVVERAITVETENSMVGEALQTRQPVIRADLQAQAGAHQTVGQREQFAVQNALTVPVFHPGTGQPIGALQVLNTLDADGWSKEATSALADVAHAIGASVAFMHEGQHLLFQGRKLDQQIAELEEAESALREGHGLRTFEPAHPLSSAGFLHVKEDRVALSPFIDPNAVKDLRETWSTGPNDIFICSPQKVGTHLTKRFVAGVANALLEERADNPYRSGDIGHGTMPWPEVMYSQHGRAVWEAHVAKLHDTPTIWYTHCRYEDIPFRSIHPRTRFVYIVRDPRAAAVSQYHFYRRHPLLQVSDSLTLDDFIDMFVGEELYFGNYQTLVQNWLHRADDRIASEQLLALCYEDLVARKADCVEALTGFLSPEKDLSATQKEAIAAATDFKAMKKEISSNPQSFHLNPNVFFRAGFNDWQAQLSDLAVSKIDARTRDVWGEALDRPSFEGVHTLTD